MFKKFFSVMLLAAMLIFVSGQNNSAQAQDVYVGNRPNGDSVYLMTDSINKKAGGYNSNYRQYRYDCHITFKSVDSRNRVFFFEQTISWGPEELAHYNGGDGHSYIADPDEGSHDPDVYRARIMQNTYVWLLNNGYV